MMRVFAWRSFGTLGALGAAALLLVCCSSFAADDAGEAPDAAIEGGSVEASPTDAAGGADVEEPADAGACPKGLARLVEDNFASLGGVWSKLVTDGGSVDVAEPYVPRSGPALVASTVVPQGGSTVQARAFREEKLGATRQVRTRFLMLLDENAFFAQIGCALVFRDSSASGYTANRFLLVRRPNGTLALTADRFVEGTLEPSAPLAIALNVVAPARWYEVELDVDMTEESARASVTVTDTTPGSSVPRGTTTDDVPLVGPIDLLELYCGANASASSGDFRIAIDDLTVDVCPR